MDGQGDDRVTVLDWFGIAGDPESNPLRKCAFCADSKLNPFEDPEVARSEYRTTNCRHIVCGVCQVNNPAKQSTCRLCGTRITVYLNRPPEYSALEELNKIRKEVNEEWNLTPDDFPNDLKGYAAFLERREDLIFGLLYAQTLEGEAKGKLLNDIRLERESFRERYRDAITRNSARLGEQRSRTLGEIRKANEELRELQALIKREREIEEENRQRLEEQRNAAELGMVREFTTTTSINQQRHQDQELKTYLFSRTDAATFGEVPTLQKSQPDRSKQKVDPVTVFRAGGLVDDVVHQRTLSEMRAGWNLLF